MMTWSGQDASMDAIAFLIAQDTTRRAVEGATTCGPAPRRRRPANRAARIRGMSRAGGARPPSSPSSLAPPASTADPPPPPPTPP